MAKKIAPAIDETIATDATSNEETTTNDETPEAIKPASKSKTPAQRFAVSHVANALQLSPREVRVAIRSIAKDNDAARFQVNADAKGRYDWSKRDFDLVVKAVAKTLVRDEDAA